MQIIEAAELTERLIVATEPLQSNNSLLPNDLGASVTVVDVIIEVLENNNSTNEVITYTGIAITVVLCMIFHHACRPLSKSSTMFLMIVTEKVGGFYSL